jgi:hypothetical protein
MEVQGSADMIVPSMVKFVEEHAVPLTSAESGGDGEEEERGEEKGADEDEEEVVIVVDDDEEEEQADLEAAADRDL